MKKILVMCALMFVTMFTLTTFASTIKEDVQTETSTQFLDSVKEASKQDLQTTQVTVVEKAQVVSKPKPKLFLRTFIPMLLVVGLYGVFGYFFKNEEKLKFLDFLYKNKKDYTLLITLVLIVFGIVSLFR